MNELFGFSTYEIKETKSALKGVTKQFTIEAKVKDLPLSFMKKVEHRLLICCLEIARQR